MPWCHLFLMMPIFGLAVFFVLPIEAAVPIYLTISAIGLLVYAKIVKALHAPVAVGREGMIGKDALVASNLQPKGLIRYRGELWTAIGKEPVRSGERVRIVAVNRNALLVERCRERAAAAKGANQRPDPACVRHDPHLMGGLQCTASHSRTKGAAYDK